MVREPRGRQTTKLPSFGGRAPEIPLRPFLMGARKRSSLSAGATLSFSCKICVLATHHSAVKAFQDASRASRSTSSMLRHWRSSVLVSASSCPAFCPRDGQRGLEAKAPQVEPFIECFDASCIGGHRLISSMLLSSNESGSSGLIYPSQAIARPRCQLSS